MPIYFSDGGTGIMLIPKKDEGSFLVHHGVKGQKKGERRYQYEDGSLTPLGYIHYGVGQGKPKTLNSKQEKKIKSLQNRADQLKNEARKMEYFKKQAVEEGKQNGEAFNTYSNFVEKFTKKAEKYEQKIAKLKEKWGPDVDLTQKVQEYADKYDRQKEAASRTGTFLGATRIKKVEELPDGEEKTKLLDQMLKDSYDYSQEKCQEILAWHKFDDIPLSIANRVIQLKNDMDPRYYEISEIDSWITGQMQSKSGDWYWHEGVSPGFKALTDKIHELDRLKEQIHDKYYDGVKSDDYIKAHKKYSQDPKVIQANKEIDDLIAKMPEQVLKDLGFTVNPENLERIKPIVFWD